MVWKHGCITWRIYRQNLKWTDFVFKFCRAREMKILTMLQNSNLLIMFHKSNIPALIYYTWSKNYSLIKWDILNKWNLKIIGVSF